MYVALHSASQQPAHMQIPPLCCGMTDEWELPMCEARE